MKKYILSALIVILFLAFVACDTKSSDTNGEEPGKKPVLNSISPTSAFSHWEPFTLTCKGSDFLPGASIVFNNKEITATYVSANELTCTINPDDTIVANSSLAAALDNTDTDVVSVFLRNPSSSTTPLESEKLDFTLINNHTFADPIKLKITQGTHHTPEMKCDSQGNIYVIFADEGIWMIKSTDHGNNWTSRIRIEKITPCSSPILYIDKNDNLYLIWAKYTSRGGYDQIYFSRSTNKG
ncbi:MAG: IPT/TIG domain-containing protein, partial [Candidatus Aminicenantes bacterium]|nr:IPT/TIG domain-containing protein [Candidatus Aminicenantes bacterium]